MTAFHLPRLALPVFTHAFGDGTIYETTPAAGLLREVAP